MTSIAVAILLCCIYELPTANLASVTLLVVEDCYQADVMPNVFCSLGEVAASINNSNGCFEIVFNSTVYTLNDQIEVSRVNELVMKGIGNSEITINCARQNGKSVTSGWLKFVKIDQFVMNYLTITNCGLAGEYVGALTLVDCHLVHLYFTSVVNSSGLGLQINNTVGVVRIDNGEFSNNKLPSISNSENGVSTGGGIQITITKMKHSKLEQIIYNISNCKIESNIRFTSDPGQFALPFASSYGAGLYVNFDGYSTHVNFTVQNCTFKRNSAGYGAGLSVMFSGCACNNSFQILDSNFSENSATAAGNGQGGGLLILFEVPSIEDSKCITNNTVLLYDVMIESNSGWGGGGMCVVGSRHISDQDNSITVEHSMWINNHASTGAAALITRNFWDTQDRGSLPNVTFISCSFINNTNIIQNSDGTNFLQGWKGQGVLFCIYFDIKFLGNLSFTGNIGSAVGTVDSTLHFNNTYILFKGNTGINGGAIGLYGLSHITVYPGVCLEFIENSATERGGAFYGSLVNEIEIVSAAACLIRSSEKNQSPSDWNATLIFSQNQAKYGHSIFMSSFLPCQILYTKAGGIVNTSGELIIFMNYNTTFQFNDGTDNQIATAEFWANDNISSRVVIPGLNSSLPRIFVDELRQNANDSTLTASVVTNAGQSLSSDSICVADNSITLMGESDAIVTFKTTEVPHISTNVSFMFSKCPPGYILEDSKCTCDVYDYYGLSKCSSDFIASVNIGAWVGYIQTLSSDSAEVVTSKCPSWFCTYNISLPSNTSPPYRMPLFSMYTVNNTQYASVLNEWICAEARTGRLCGTCIDNSTVYFNNRQFRCREETSSCSFGWLLFVLSSLAPLTLIFLFISIFGIQLTDGSLRGFLLFCQIIVTLDIEIGGSVTLPQPVFYLKRIWSLLYDMFNMRFFNDEIFSYCLLRKASALDMLVVQYCTTLYAFLLVISAVLVLERCAWRCNNKCHKIVRIARLKGAVVSGLSALLILCYGNCTTVSFRILNTVSLFGEKHTVHLKHVVLYNGNMTLFDAQHMPYAIPALFCLCTIVLLPPTIFLFCPLMNKILVFMHLENTCLGIMASRCFLGGKLQVFRDVFQSCFKDNCNFVAGLYFFYLLIVIMADLFSQTFTETVFITEIIIIAMLTVHGVLQPYTDPRHNITDTLLFANLVIINAISHCSYLSLIFPDVLMNVTVLTSIQAVLIMIPICCFVIHLCYQIYNVQLYNKAHRELSTSVNSELTHYGSAVESRKEGDVEHIGMTGLKRRQERSDSVCALIAEEQLNN